ncbi:hypothetical protein QAD02_010937 [Eretmocerus hayati]|uniref:Uncharacterized protein n=1 Tax=Eretmocerus hayati TaxID=131215 RepID=A0ACC2NWG3_9HYME|nr:hypothetical protein QAD02_010937 [Eretmocerus hayati]
MGDKVEDHVPKGTSARVIIECRECGGTTGMESGHRSGKHVELSISDHNELSQEKWRFRKVAGQSGVIMIITGLNEYIGGETMNSRPKESFNMKLDNMRMELIQGSKKQTKAHLQE